MHYVMYVCYLEMRLNRYSDFYLFYVVSFIYTLTIFQMCMYVCMYVYMYVCISLCMYVCMYV